MIGADLVFEWRSIDENPAAAEPIILLGISARVPAAYLRGRSRRGTWFQVAALASLLWKCIAWSISILAHLIVAILLVSLIVARPREKDLIVAINLSRGDAGDHGKALPETKPKENKESKARKEEPKKPDKEKKKPEVPPEKLPEEVPLPPKFSPAFAKAEKKDPKEAAPTPALSRLSNVIGGGVGNVLRSLSKGTPLDGRLIEKDTTAATKSRRAGDLAKLRRGSDREIVVVRGVYDHVERVLDALEIPHTSISARDLAHHDFSRCRILLINCNSDMSRRSEGARGGVDVEKELERLERQVKGAEEEMRAARRRGDRRREMEIRLRLRIARGSMDYYRKLVQVRRFVRKGGYLFTSDWGLTILERAFPGFVANGGNYGPREVSIEPRRNGHRHPLLRDVFAERAENGTTRVERKMKWEIDSGSYLIRIRSQRVERLVESPQISGHRSVAVTFSPPAGKGKVLHVLSHFAKQSQSSADRYGEYALQNLLLNFILEGAQK